MLLKTIDNGGSETEHVLNGLKKNDVRFFTLPSRRTFSPFFGKSISNRNTYLDQSSLQPVRGSQLDAFAYRLFNIQKNPVAFNSELKKVLGYTPIWQIAQAEGGNYYLKFNYNGSFHNSDGAGEGLLSIFTIVDTLYDSNENDLIFIDEPELSLHPSLQRKILNLFLEYSATRQIVISTHSPFFINWHSISNGGQIARTVRENTGTKIHQLQNVTADKIITLLNNLNNPHILGLDAREIFFLDDNIILVEGQEDVIFLNRILQIKNKNLNGTFYGWGVGGADNTDKVILMLQDLGFKKIAVILDKNMQHKIFPLQQQFPNYKFVSIPTDDIREKIETKSKAAVEGLIDAGGKNINPKYDSAIDALCTDINSYLI